MKILVLVTLCFLLWACAKPKTQFKTLPEGHIKHQLIVVGETAGGVRARGFLGATPPNTKIFFELGKKNHTVTSKPDGSFDITLTDADKNIDYSEFTFFIGDKPIQQAYTVKRVAQALQSVAHPGVLGDKEISGISFSTDKVAILSSDASLVRTMRFDSHWVLEDEPINSILLNEENDLALGARAITAVGDYLVTPFFKTHEVALLDKNLTKVVAKVRLRDANQKLVIVDVQPELSVKSPIDANGSGAQRTIKQTAARNAEAVIALDDQHVLVSFVNYYQFDEREKNQKAVVGPGIIALFKIDNNTLVPRAYIVTPFKNPTQFLKKDNKTVWVVCSGVWQLSQNNKIDSSEAGLVRLSVATDTPKLAIEHRIPLTNFAPAEIALVGDKLVIPRSFQSELAVIDERATQIRNEDRHRMKGHDDFEFTFATHWHADIVFLGEASGTLIAYSLTEGFLPFPFVEPIVLDKNVDPKTNLMPLKLYFRHGIENIDLSKTTMTGYTAWVASLSHKLYPLDFLSLFGP